MARGELSRKTLIVAAGNAVQMLIAQVAVNLFLVRLTGPEVFGTYRQVWLLLNTLFPVLLFGLHFGAYFYLPSLPLAARRGFVTRSAGLLLGIGLLAGAAMAVGAPALAHFFNNLSLAPVLRAAALYFALTLPASFLFHCYIAVERQSRAVLWNLGFFVPQSLLIVGLIWSGASLAHLFVALALLAVVRGLVGVRELRRQFATGLPPGEAEKSRVSLRELLVYSLPVGMAATVAIVGEKLDKFVVSATLDPEQFALYSVGAVEFPLTVLLATATVTIMRPRIASLHHAGDSGAIYRFWREAYRKIALLLIPATVFLALTADPLMRLMYTDAYAAAAGVFRVYLLVTLLRIAPPEPLLTSSGHTRAVFWGGVGFLVLDLGLNLLLIRRLGLIGPPVATALATLTLHLFLVSVAARVLRVPLRSMFPIGLVAPICGLALVAALPVLGILRLSWGPTTTLVSAGLAYLVVYAGAGWFLGWIRPDELRGVIPPALHPRLPRWLQGSG